MSTRKEEVCIWKLKGSLSLYLGYKSVHPQMFQAQTILIFSNYKVNETSQGFFRPKVNHERYRGSNVTLMTLPKVDLQHTILLCTPYMF
jgi:hypothetical protein